MDELETTSRGGDATVAGKRRARLFGLDPVKHRRSEARMAAHRAKKEFNKHGKADSECRELDAELNQGAARIGDLNKVQRKLEVRDFKNMSSSSGQ